MRKVISLYMKYVSIILQSSMQYKISFVLSLIGRFFVAFSSFLAIHFLFTGFTDVKGYTYGEVLLCFSIVQMSFYLSSGFAHGFVGFAGIVRSGEFDRILVRPVSPILQILGSKFDLGRLGPLLSAVLTLIVGITNNDIIWTGDKILTLLLMLFGGTLLFSGLFLIGATVSFFTLEQTECINILTYGANEHGKYPIDIYGKDMMKFCTYIIPYTLVQYYPLQYLLGRTQNWYYALYPCGVIVFLMICYGFWRFGVAHYTSSGS